MISRITNATGNAAMMDTLLQVRHGAVGKYKRHWQQDQHDRPEGLYGVVGLLIACDLAVGVGGSHKGDGVEAGGVEGYHGNDQKHKDKWRKRQCVWMMGMIVV